MENPLMIFATNMRFLFACLLILFWRAKIAIVTINVHNNNPFCHFIKPSGEAVIVVRSTKWLQDTSF
jgi:hypothetical protein